MWNKDQMPKCSLQNWVYRMPQLSVGSDNRKYFYLKKCIFYTAWLLET